MADKIKVCTSCGYVGRPTRGEPGPVEILLLFLLLLFFIVPGAIYLFFLVRGQRACPKCKTAAMIPVDTPLGQKLMKETGQPAPGAPVAPAPRFKNKTEYERWRATQGREEPK
jgi:hypothetical protein